MVFVFTLEGMKSKQVGNNYIISPHLTRSVEGATMIACWLPLLTHRCPAHALFYILKVRSPCVPLSGR